MAHDEFVSVDLIVVGLYVEGKIVRGGESTTCWPPVQRPALGQKDELLVP